MRVEIKLLQGPCKAKMHDNELRRFSTVYKQGGPLCHPNVPIGQRKGKRDLEEGRMIWEQGGRRKV